MKKRTLLVLLAALVICTCAVFGVQAEQTTVDLSTFNCPCSHCDGKPYGGKWITVEDLNNGKNILKPDDGDHFYITGTYLVEDQIGVGENKEVVFLLDNGTLQETKASGRLFGVNAAGAVLHVIGNNGKLTGNGFKDSSGAIMMIGKPTAEAHLYGDLTVEKLASSTNAISKAGLFRLYEGLLHIHDCDGMGLPTDNDPVLNAPELADKTAAVGGVTNLERETCTFTMDAGTLNGTTKALSGGVLNVTNGIANLNGGTLNASKTEDAVVSGGAVNVAGGQLKINGATINGGAASNGGAIYLKSGSVTMESGIINGGSVTGQGGVAYVSGSTFEMKGGTVNVASTGSGAKGFRVQGKATVRFSGNAVVNCPGLRVGDAVDLVSTNDTTPAKLILAGNATLQVTADGQPTGQWSNVIHAQNFNNKISKVEVEAGWTGSASVRYDHIFGSTYKTENYAIAMPLSASAAAATGDFTGKLYMEAAPNLPTIHWDGATGMRASDVQICTEEGVNWHKDNAAAVAAYAADPQGYIKLYNAKPVDLAGNAVYVDFNGFSPAVTIGTGKLYGMDSSAAGTSAGATQLTLSGNAETFVTAPVTGESFIALAEDGVTTFHKIKPMISGVSLKAEKAGIYYTGKVECDSILRDRITACGIALSTKEMPKANFQKNTMYTRDDKVADDGSFNSVLVRDILKEEADNETRALTNIYANAYVTVKVNGQEKTYLSDASGSGADLNLRRVMRKTNNIWRDLNETQKQNVVALYDRFGDLLGSEDWRLYNINAYRNGDTHVKSDLKILMIGNSLSVDAGHMLTYIAKLEGAESVHISTLYYGGCRLQQHVDFLTNDKAVYRFYNSYHPDLQSVTDLKDLTPKVLSVGDNYTMQMGLEYENTPWDIIVMQQGVFEAGQADTYNEDMQTIMDYARAHCSNPDVIFVWNSIWAPPVHPERVEKANNGIPPESTGFEKNYKINVGYAEDQALDQAAQDLFFGKIAEAVRTKVATNPAFSYFIPSGTAQQNALSSALWDDTDLYRDYIHATDISRFINSYVWYCALTDMKFDGVDIDAIPLAMRYNKKDDQSEVEPATTDLKLTEEMKSIITWSIQKAFENPYECTPYPAQ